MFVLDVIPLSRTAPEVPLSYRSTKNLPSGTLVSVPLRRKTVAGLVVGSTPVRDLKGQLKSAGFSLSRSSSTTLGKLPAPILKAGNAVATYYATTLGAVLSALLVPVMSDAVFSSASTTSAASAPKFSKGGRGARFKEEYVEMTARARIERYRKLVGEEGTTLLVVPTHAEAEEWAVVLRSSAPLVLSGKLIGAKREAAIARASGFVSIAGSSSRPPEVVIATPGFAWIPIPKLARIIVERVSAGSYVLPKRPHLNVVYALTELARARDIPIVYGDYPLPLEYRAGVLSARGKPLKEAPTARVTIFDSRIEKGEVWKAVPDAARAEIKKVIEKGGRAAVLAVRRGYAPTVICRDCGTAVTDDYGRTLSLVTANGKRQFRSTDGTTVEDAGAKSNLHCKNCDSWNLMPLGVGVERVEEELRAAFPKANIVRIDHDTKRTRSKMIETISAPATIVVGTESMLSYLPLQNPFELGVIASADSLLSLPFWRARERFVRVGLMFAERVQKLIVATRLPEEAALSALTSPTTSDFWQEELSLRKVLQYPPFGALVVFQTEGTIARIADARAAIAKTCAPYHVIDLPPRATSATTLRAISVLHVTERAWPNASLSARLARLSPNIRIHIDAESLW